MSYADGTGTTAAVASDGTGSAAERLSLGVAARLSRYLQVLTQAKKMGKETIGAQPVRHTGELRQVVEDEDIVVGVLAVPGNAAQGLADELVDAGVKIIFNYSESLLAVPPEVTVHTSSPAVDLLYALYFYLT